MYKKHTANTLLKVMPLDEDTTDSFLFQYYSSPIIDLREIMDIFRQDCRLALEGIDVMSDPESYWLGNDEDAKPVLEYIMPYLRYVTYNYTHKEVIADEERCAYGLLYSDIVEMIEHYPAPNRAILAEAHVRLGKSLIDVFVMIGLVDDDGFIPYTFVSRLSPDAYLFALPTTPVYTGLDDDESNPLLPSLLPIRIPNPKRHSDEALYMASVMIKEKLTDDPEQLKRARKILEENGEDYHNHMTDMVSERVENPKKHWTLNLRPVQSQ